VQGCGGRPAAPSRLTRPHRTFPAPVAELQQGKVWRASDVEKWIAKYRPELAGGSEEEDKDEK